MLKSSRKIRKKQTGTTTVSRSRAATRFSNCPPQSSQLPGGQLHLARDRAPAPRATNEPMSRPRTLACTTIAALAVLAADLVRALRRPRCCATAPSGTKPRGRSRRAHVRRDASATRRRRSSVVRQRDRQVRQRVEVLARIVSGRRTTRSKRRSPSKTCPASRPPTATATTSCTSATLRP